ncbi:MAG: DNA-formamidopyrimidine glycosylase family protein [Acidimicrobiia bacterium]
MPEGDTYTRAAAVARRVLEGHTVLGVAGVPDIRRRADRVIGHVVCQIRTIGKHLLIDLTSGWTIHVWLGMPGRVTVAEGSTRSFIGERPRGPTQSFRTGATRLRLETSQGTVTVQAAPTVEIVRRRVIDASLKSLGTDVLADPFDWDSYTARAERVDPARPVTDVIIDQRVLAGIGNEYKNEILFLERLDPLTRWEQLSTADIEALARRAIALMGPNATRSRRITTGAANPGGERWVYQRAGLGCRRCRSPIRVAEMGSPPRRTFWCPVCQAPRTPNL